MDELALFDRILGGAIVLRSGEGLPGFEMFYVLNPAIEGPGSVRVEEITLKPAFAPIHSKIDASLREHLGVGLIPPFLLSRCLVFAETDILVGWVSIEDGGFVMRLLGVDASSVRDMFGLEIADYYEKLPAASKVDRADVEGAIHAALKQISDAAEIKIRLMLYQAVDLGEGALECAGPSPGITE